MVIDLIYHTSISFTNVFLFDDTIEIVECFTLDDDR